MITFYKQQKDAPFSPANKLFFQVNSTGPVIAQANMHGNYKIPYVVLGSLNSTVRQDNDFIDQLYTHIKNEGGLIVQATSTGTNSGLYSEIYPQHTIEWINKNHMSNLETVLTYLDEEADVEASTINIDKTEYNKLKSWAGKYDSIGVLSVRSDGYCCGINTVIIDVKSEVNKNAKNISNGLVKEISESGGGGNLTIIIDQNNDVDYRRRLTDTGRFGWFGTSDLSKGIMFFDKFVDSFEKHTALR